MASKEITVCHSEVDNANVQNLEIYQVPVALDFEELCATCAPVIDCQDCLIQMLIDQGY